MQKEEQNIFRINYSKTYLTKILLIKKSIKRIKKKCLYGNTN